MSVYRQYYRNGQYDIEKFKASTLNKFSYLPDRVQDRLDCCAAAAPGVNCNPIIYSFLAANAAVGGKMP